MTCAKNIGEVNHTKLIAMPLFLSSICRGNVGTDQAMGGLRDIDLLLMNNPSFVSVLQKLAYEAGNFKL